MHPYHVGLADLGALKMQVEFGLPSIGGKDSMSGTFENINVPPLPFSIYGVEGKG